MGIMPSSISNEDIIKEIRYLSGDFHSKFKQYLDIEDMIYEIKLQDYKEDKDRYPDPNTKACIVPVENEKKVKELFFFTQSICNSINESFSKLHGDMFKEVISIMIKFFLLHELAHVKQIKDGMTMEQYKAIKYEDSPAEKEANDFAIERLTCEGEFTKHIVQLISGRSKKSIDALYLSELQELFKKQCQT